MLTFAAFVVGLISDYFWARSIRAVQARHPLGAANWSTLLCLCGILSTELVIERQIAALIGFITGGYIGTYLGVLKRSQSSTSQTSSMIK
jgi:hypothetical protein